MTKDVSCAPDMRGALKIKRFALVIAAIAAGILASNGCGGKGAVGGGKPEFTFQAKIPLELEGIELSTPSLYPDTEYGGVYIAAGNSSDIYRYDPALGLELYVHPQEIPPGAGGIASFCYADGDFFFIPSVAGDTGESSGGLLYQLTSSGRIRRMEPPEDLYDDVLDFSTLIYLGEGRLLIETHPKGPFAIINFITGAIERHPVEFPPKGQNHVLVPDYSASEVYLIRRAKDKSVYLLRYPFRGGYRGDEYIARRELPAGAATVNDYHMFQYGSGMVDMYDFMFEKQLTVDFAGLAADEYTLMLGLVIVRDHAYVIGMKGSVQSPEGYDLLVFNVKTSE